MGVVECLNHHLVEPYNVLYEKEGEVHHCITGLIHLYIRVNVKTRLSVYIELVKSCADYFKCCIAELLLRAGL